MIKVSNNQNFDFLFEKSPIAIGMTDASQKIMRVNNKFCELFNYTREELLNLSILDITYVEDQKKNSEHLKLLFCGEFPEYSSEERYIRKDESTLWARVTVSAEKSKNDQIENILYFLEDLSKEKAREDAIGKAKVLAEQISQAKTDFLATMSHEIRTPLCAITGFSELLEEHLRKVNDDEGYDFARRINNNSAHLRCLIDSILDISKIESGKLVIEKKNVDLAEVLSEIIDAMKPQAVAKGLLFKFISKEGLPTKLITDSLRLKQLLFNIIGNAIKFTEKGSVELKLTVESSGTSSLLKFSVKDTGIGISQNQQNNLFQPFNQADASIIRRYGGTGLGLMLSRKISRALGGDVVLAHSSPGKGSEFIITIDTGKSTLESNQRQKLFLVDFEKTRTNSRIISQTLSGMRILVVEDMEDIRALIEEILRSTGGAEVDIAENGETAVKMAKSKDYDLILMDVMMPVMDGLEATRQIKTLGIQTPIILLSARTMKPEIQSALELGCEEYLTKPIETKKLISVVRKYKQKHST